MVNINMTTKGALDRNSILSVNRSDPQGVKNQNNIGTIIRSPRQSAASATPSRQPVHGRPSAPGPLPNPPSQGPAGHSRAIPVLQNKVQKGQKTLLFASRPDPIRACFGWNTSDTRCDVDVSAFMLGENGKVPGDSWFVFYGQDTSPDQSTKFVAGGAADREMIQIDFGRLDSRVEKIVFVLTINDALANHLNFGMIKDAYVRLMDSSGRELVSFMITDYYTNIISMMIGEVYRHNGAWKFNAVGNGVNKDLAGLCGQYGVQVAG